jgi:hypothetical protein
MLAGTTSSTNPQRQGYRTLIAMAFSILAVAFYVADPELNLQNALMGLAALVSIAATILPRLRHHAPEPETEITHHIGA